MHAIRPDEPAYALLPNVRAPAVNQYGQPIETVPEGHALRGASLRINHDASIGIGADRYKQHGFYFNADNCIACHACESACSEKNGLPAHLAFRSVGYVEGGSWPNYQRMNISMACNHCDDPVCLKGCPTRAYTKFAEYGAVLQDPDICFGCGYCTWVCPYNAPQLDPVKGQVEKCNMCVDRLEVGLKPACAAACLAGALDFGIIETRPAGREQIETRLPGFPDPAITHPNIRFQQTRTLPRELTRPDSMPLRYERGDDGAFVARVRAGHSGHASGPDPTDKPQRAWNLARLRSREDPLVCFTLATQLVIGAFATVVLASLFGPASGIASLTAEAHPVAVPLFLVILLGIETAALVFSTMHLGKPQRFYRAFNNLRYSPVSREVAGVAVFYNLLGAYTLITILPGLAASVFGDALTLLRTALGLGGILAGLAALWFMHRIYRIPARPFWNHWQVLTAFYGSMLTLGGLAAGWFVLFLALTGGETAAATGPVLPLLALPIALGLAAEAIGLCYHTRDLRRGAGEGAASHHEQTTTFGLTWLARNAGLVTGLLVATALMSGMASGTVGIASVAVWLLLSLIVLASEVIGRALFYVLVIPTTMPGAFFWRNRGFQEHARATGLAQLPQTGVIPDAH